jgi:hypothetical protein
VHNAWAGTWMETRARTGWTSGTCPTLGSVGYHAFLRGVGTPVIGITSNQQKLQFFFSLFGQRGWAVVCAIGSGSILGAA